MGNLYLELKQSQEKRLKELQEDYHSKLDSIGKNGLTQTKYYDKFYKLSDTFIKEFEKATQNEQFIYDMFYYHLGKFNYHITNDLMPILDDLGLTHEEVEGNEKLFNGLMKAKSDYLKNCK